MKNCNYLLPLILLLILVAQPSFAQKTKEFSKTVEFDREGRVTLDTFKGSIDVTTWDRDEVSIDVIVEADKNEELVPLTEVRIHRSGKTLQIESDYTKAKKKGRRFLWFGDSNSHNLPFVHYTIRMPRTAELIIDDYKSEIVVESLAADLDVETYKGDVKINDVTGDLRIDTYKGVVSIEDLSGSLDVDTYKGSVTVDINELTGHSAIDTYRGEVSLIFPKNAGFDLDADIGKGGDLDTDFRLSNVKIDRKNYRGEIGGGGPNLDIDTYRGHIQLSTH